jgi:hypothetical protein
MTKGASESKRESGRTEVIRVDGGCVVAKETVSDGVSWITLTRFEDTLEPSEEARALPR